MSLEDSFREEAEDLLSDLEAAMLELEDNPSGSDGVDRAFRVMHTIKGTGAMFGFDKLAAFTHHLENTYDLVRNGELEITKELISVSLDSGDHIRELLQNTDGGTDLDKKSEILLDRLHSLVSENNSSDRTTADEMDETQDTDKCEDSKNNETESDVVKTYHLKVSPDLDAFTNGMDILPILREIRSLGPCRVTTVATDIPELSDFDPERCYLRWEIVLTTNQDVKALKDVFIFVEDEWSIDIDSGGAGDKCGTSKTAVASDSCDASECHDSVEGSEHKNAEMTSTSITTVKEDDGARNAVNASSSGSKVTSRATNSGSRRGATNVKVPSERLDQLMDLVGELVIAQSRLSQSVNEIADPSLLSIAEDIEHLTTELRDNTLELRMLPIGTTFSRFRRLVRDLSNDLGKEIELVTEGAETEIDKTVLDQLGDPLVHLIRNSIDHGIESPEVRVQSGKGRKGTLLISASHHESHIVITIMDDGAGLDAEAIREKAIERGVITEDTVITDKELYNLVFDAGFSTAKNVSNVSGRGVGMDVVKRSIEDLRGTVNIDSKKGSGCTITISLPLTLAIIDGLLVKVEDEKYVIPLSQVDECIELTEDDVKKSNGNRLIRIRGELLPYIRLRECFNNKTDMLDIEQIVVIRNEDRRYGFTVDEVIGHHQTVIKGLGKMYEGIKGVSGATILGDGNVALILDTNILINDASMVSMIH